MAGGLFAASALTLVPAAGDSILAEARRRGIPVTVIDDPMTGVHAEHAAQLRGAAERLTEALRRLRAADPEAAKAEAGAAALAELEQLRADRPAED